MSAKLSVNINKIATLRNSRGGDWPNVLKTAIDCETFGAEGITVHPRPDERHIRYQDVRDLHPILNTEFNIEGYPGEGFIQLALENKPAQVTLVPDGPDVLTSNAGWDTISHKEQLTSVIKRFKAEGIRTSLFVDPDPEIVKGAFEVGADRIELYTEAYATNYANNKNIAIEPYIIAAKKAYELGLGINAGHDLNLENLKFFAANIPHLDEVSIGHALIADALYYGLQNTIQMYLRQLND